MLAAACLTVMNQARVSLRKESYYYIHIRDGGFLLCWHSVEIFVNMPFVKAFYYIWKGPCCGDTGCTTVLIQI